MTPEPTLCCGCGADCSGRSKNLRKNGSAVSGLLGAAPVDVTDTLTTPSTTSLSNGASVGRFEDARVCGTCAPATCASAAKLVAASATAARPIEMSRIPARESVIAILCLRAANPFAAQL